MSLVVVLWLVIASETVQLFLRWPDCSVLVICLSRLQIVAAERFVLLLFVLVFCVMLLLLFLNLLVAGVFEWRVGCFVLVKQRSLLVVAGFVLLRIHFVLLALIGERIIRYL